MKRTSFSALILLVGLMSAAQVRAQTWENRNALKLVLPSNATDPSKTLTILAPSITGSSFSWTLPDGNSSGILVNGGTGTLSWTQSLTGLTIENSTIGATTANSGRFTSITTTTGGANFNSNGITNAGAISGATTLAASTSITSPIHYGGSAGNDELSLRSTSSATHASDLISFYSNAVERMRLTNGGNLLIGNTNGTNMLSIGSTSQFTVSSAGAITGTSLALGSGGITATGAIAGATSLTLSGAISGGTTYSGSGDITSTTGKLITGSNSNAGNVKIGDGAATNHFAILAAATQAADRTFTIQDPGAAANVVVERAGGGEIQVAGTAAIGGSDLTNATTTPASTGLSFAVGAGETWAIQAYINFSCTSTHGAVFTISSSAGTFTYDLSAAGRGNATTYLCGRMTDAGTTTSPIFNVTATDAQAIISGLVKSTSASTITINYQAGTSATTVSIHPGSVLKAEKVN
jgi:hypothetical protein